MLLFSERLSRWAFAVVPVLLALLHVTGWVRLDPLDRLDLMVQDIRLRATMPQTLDERIVIIDIDEKSLAEVGRWPWSRTQIATLTERLFDEHHVAVLGFDVVFAEPEPPHGGVDPDTRFAHVLQGRNVVLGHYFSSDRNGHASGQLPRPVMPSDRLKGAPVMTWNGYAGNLPALVAAARSGGFFNAVADTDGVIRSAPLLAEHQGQVFEAFSLAVFRSMWRETTVEPGFPPGTGHLGLNGVVLRQGNQQLFLPVDERANALVPYRGRGGPQGGSFAYISASDVLAGRLAPGTLRDKVALVGTSVPGLLDARVTPVGVVYPGVEVHANLIAGFWDGHVPVRPDYAPGYELLLTVLCGLALAWGLPRMQAWRAVGLMAALLTATVGLNTWLYMRHGLVLPLMSSVGMVVLAFVLHMAHGYFAENRAKRHLAHLFGTYVPPELVKEMLKNPGQYSMQAQERELTVMFCDIRGFTQMAETMPPVQLQAMLNHVFSELTHIIRTHRGTIDKYMGDCVMAFWGAPVPSEDHAHQAVEAAIAMVKAMDRINQHGKSQGWPEVRIGIGINTGTMLVGDMGSDERRAYTVVGDAVNVAARLQEMTRQCDADVLACETTCRQIPYLSWRVIDRVTLKGRMEAVRCFYLDRTD